jgi:hypothetical protein
MLEVGMLRDDVHRTPVAPDRQLAHLLARDPLDGFGSPLGGGVSTHTPHSKLVLRCEAGPGGPVGPSLDSRQAVQYLSIRYTERLAEAGIEPSVGSVGRFLRQCARGRRSSGCTRPKSSGSADRGVEEVEFATLE